MTAPEISEEMRQAVLNANLTKLLPAEVDRILEAVAPLLIRQGMERAAEIADDQLAFQIGYLIRSAASEVK